MAPNTVTLLGFLPIFFLFLLSIQFKPAMTLNENLPSWFWLLNAVILIFYQTMDAMDGRHARNTGSSSPLGQLFDHGLDSINSFLSSILILTMLNAGELHPIYSLVFLFISGIPFFYSTLEEYYTHCLRLPLINGPTEGILLVAACYIIGFNVDSSFFITPISTTMPRVFSLFSPLFPFFAQVGTMLGINESIISAYLQNLHFVDLLMLSSIFLLVGTLWSILVEVLKHRGSDSFISRFAEFWGQSFPCLLIVFTSIHWCFTRPDDFTLHRRRFLISIGFYISQISMRLMVNRLVNSKSPIFHIYIPFWIAGYINNVYFDCAYIPCEFVFNGLFVLSVLVGILFYTSIVHDFLSFLGIRLFNIDDQLAAKQRAELKRSS